MNDSPRWIQGFNRPWTNLLILPVPIISFGGFSYIFSVMEPLRRTPIIWMIWGISSIAAWLLFFAIWKKEEQGEMSLAAKRVAWRVWFGVFLLGGIVSLLGIFWPESPWSLKLKSGALFCGVVVGLLHIRPFLRR